ncbi:hypothetical protein GQ55_1G004800 [Panicum hallii var. hallii]|uniref:Uncharacterized protein n=1 Tax=Panicum hallii var. hallii TaxID=1504633 RepID=A0A2T7F0P9_9POAL|nr:hypothetical protein GQ55_1G004800 [Panicum hallii var. hallii]
MDVRRLYSRSNEIIDRPRTPNNSFTCLRQSLHKRSKGTPLHQQQRGSPSHLVDYCMRKKHMKQATKLQAY